MSDGTDLLKAVCDGATMLVEQSGIRANTKVENSIYKLKIQQHTWKGCTFLYISGIRPSLK